MKRKNDQDTFWGVVKSDLVEFRGYVSSGNLFYDLLENSSYQDEPPFIFYVLGGVWFVQMLIGAGLSWVISVSYLTCGLSLLFLGGVLPLVTTLLILRYMMFKSDQWKESIGK